MRCASPVTYPGLFVPGSQKNSRAIATPVKIWVFSAEKILLLDFPAGNKIAINVTVNSTSNVNTYTVEHFLRSGVTETEFGSPGFLVPRVVWGAQWPT